jgi:tetratricopeptide (TPR) repeat protein
MKTVSLDTMRPAEVTFPSNVENLLIVDRTIYKQDTYSIIEGVLTGELPGEDRSGVQTWIYSFRQRLGASPRFQTVVADEMLPGNSLTHAFPEQLSWNTINDLNRRYQTDAVVAIEIFDSDFDISNGSREVKGSDDNTQIQYYADGTANVTIGIRVYDPRTESIIDQQLFTRSSSYNATGVTLREAVEKLINKSDATRALSQGVGTEFANKIAPMPIQIRRSFYGSSDKAPALEQGARYADVGNWRGASEAWQTGIATAPQEEAGQLAYNIAIAYEVLGEFEQAREWAERAYVSYGNNRARGYVTDLDNRLYSEALAQQQMQ